MAVDAQATIRADTALVPEREARKYGPMYRLIRLYGTVDRALRRQPTPEPVTIEITPAPTASTRAS